MAENNTAATSGGIGIFGAMFIVLFTLKLLGVITISWWWVTAPLWGPFLFVIIILLIIFGLALAAGK